MNYTFHPVESCNMCGGAGRVLGRRLNGSQGLRPKCRVGVSVAVMRCTRCGLIYPNPMPVPHSISDHYGVPPEEYWREEYFAIPEGHLAHEFAQMRRLAPHARTFLDVGAGIGKTMRVALDREGLDAHGVEPSAQFLDRAVSKIGIPADRLTLSPVEDVEFDAGRFDLISLGVVLEHLYDPAAVLSQVLRWLAPGGVVHVEVPSADFLFSKLFNLYFWLARTDFVVNISPMHVPFHIYEFTERSFEIHGREAGYRIAHLERYAGDTMITPKLSKLLAPVMDAERTGVGLVVYLQREAGATGNIPNGARDGH